MVHAYASCPDGFVIPDDPYDEDVVWMYNTTCAESCRLDIEIYLIIEIDIY
jgi:hypothetical protein